MTHDWPDHMQMSEEAFVEYVSKQERDDFEVDIRNISCTLEQLILARRETIVKLRQSADYLDSVWYGSKVAKGVGTSASVIGGGLTIAGGVLTLATAGAAAPLLIAGIATSSVGAATNIGTSIAEKAISSKEVRNMSNALSIDRDLTLKMESQIDDLRRFKDSAHLGSLLVMAEMMLGPTHIIVAILQSIFSYDTTGILTRSARFFSEGVRCSIQALSSEAGANNNKLAASGHGGGCSQMTKSASLQQVAREGAALAEESNLKHMLSDPMVAGSAAAGVVAAGAAVAVASTAVKESAASSSTSAVCRSTARAAAGAVGSTQLKYSPLGTDIFLETGKVVGQNSTRLAGRVIVGVSAAFLVWDTIDLGLTIADLIRKKGSQAAKILRDKADELEEALTETKAQYSVKVAQDL